MDLLKKHYEKVLLGAVLIGLALAAAFLPFLIGSEKAKLEEARNIRINPSVKPLTNLDLSMPEMAFKRLAAPAAIDFSATNKLFNPVRWRKTTDEQLIKDTTQNIGPAAVTITRLTPLYLTLTLDSVTTSDTGPRYVLGVEREAAPTAAKRQKSQKYCKLHDKNDVFVLVDVKGAPDNPDKVVLELNETGEQVSVSKEQPFKRVDGYKADLKYDPEKKTWPDRRVGAMLPFNGEEYNIVAINQNEVVLSAKSNQKKWTVTAKPNAAP